MKLKSFIVVFLFALMLCPPLTAFAAETSYFKKTDSGRIIVYVNDKEFRSTGVKTVNGVKCFIQNGKVMTVDGKTVGFIKANDEKTYLIEAGSLYNGVYDIYYYTDGEVDTSVQGFIKHKGKHYLFYKGKLFTGIYKKQYYTKGLFDNSINGYKSVSGTKYHFTKGVLSNGLYDDRYFADGLVDTSVDGFKTVNNKNYLFSKGVLFTGLNDITYYTKGLKDTSVNGFKTVNNKNYLFSKGVLFTGLHDKSYYTKGLFDASIVGYKKVGDTTYYFNKGNLANGLFDSKYMTNGIKDTSKSGIYKFSNKDYCFSKGDLFTGLYAKRYWTKGLLDVNVNGYRTVNSTKYYFVKGSLANGLYDAKYMKDGIKDSSKTGYYTFNNIKYYFKSGSLYNGLYNKAIYKAGKIDTSVTGYKTYDKKYYFINGRFANGIYVKHVFKNGLVDTTYNKTKKIGKFNVKFKKGTVYQGIYEGYYYDDGKVKDITKTATVSGLKVYLKKGKLTTALVWNKKNYEYYLDGIFNKFTGVYGNYYLKKGISQKGRIKIDGKYYYYDESNHKIVKSKTLQKSVSGNYYYTDENGVMYNVTTGYLQYPTYCHYTSAGFPNYSSGKYHGGLDYPCSNNSAVHAADGGIVVTVANLGGKSYGKYIVIKCKNRYIWYGHLNSQNVHSGQVVKKNDIIGYSGSTGNSTGPHLHFEIRPSNNSHSSAINPRPYVGTGKYYL